MIWDKTGQNIRDIVTEKNCKVYCHISHKYEITNKGTKPYLALNLINCRRWVNQEKGRNNHINFRNSNLKAHMPFEEPMKESLK